MEAASSVNKELVRGASAKRKIDEESDTDSSGDPWLQVRHHLTKLMERANLSTARQEEMFLANVKEQVERLMKEAKAYDADAVDRQKAGKSLKADAIQAAVIASEASAPKSQEFTSEVPGVAWHKGLQKWRVQIYQQGGKSIYGGIFTEKAAAEAKCLELRQHQERKVATSLEDRHVLPPKARHAAARSAQKPTQSQTLVKQSGVKHVYWSRTQDAWRVVFPRLDSKGKQIGRTYRVFAVEQFLVGRSQAEADTAALEAAKAFRAELVQKGILSEPKPRDPNFTSEVLGVFWHKVTQKWMVTFCCNDKRIYGGLFKEKAAAEAKCLELRKEQDCR
eukprot:Skav221147  [mRNA]  locus=scaffold2925:96748:97752:+ [translate_table: standard]